VMFAVIDTFLGRYDPDHTNRRRHERMSDLSAESRSKGLITKDDWGDRKLVRRGTEGQLLAAHRPLRAELA
jgi:hypothetical protein